MRQNQILVTEKIIVTKEMRKKKRFYKRNFFLSIFLIIVLGSYYIYAEIDRNNNEAKSKDILDEINSSLFQDGEDITTITPEMMIASNTVRIEDDILKVYLGMETETAEEIKLGNILRDVKTSVEEIAGDPTGPDDPENVEAIVETYQTDDGQTTYTAESIVKIPSLGIEYPVLSETNEELLKISVNKLWGPNPNEVGNYCIVGHNYKSGKMFGKLHNIKEGATVELTDLTGRTITYVVSKIYIIEPTDVSCTSQRTNGKKMVTLITCANSGTKRLVVQAYEKE